MFMKLFCSFHIVPSSCWDVVGELVHVCWPYHLGLYQARKEEQRVWTNPLSNLELSLIYHRDLFLSNTALRLCRLLSQVIGLSIALVNFSSTYACVAVGSSLTLGLVVSVWETKKEISQVIIEHKWKFVRRSCSFSFRPWSSSSSSPRPERAFQLKAGILEGQKASHHTKS